MFLVTLLFFCCVLCVAEKSGKEKAPTFPPESYDGGIIRLTKGKFNKYVFTKKRDYYVMMSFTTDDESCGICQMIAGHYKSVVDSWNKAKTPDSPPIYFTELMYEEKTQQIAGELQLTSLPSLMLFTPGKKTPEMYDPEGKKDAPEPLSRLDTPAPLSKPVGLGKHKYRARGKFGPHISKSRWETDQKALTEAASPRPNVDRASAWAAASIGEFVAEHLDTKFEVKASKGFPWSKLPQYIVIITITISAFLYIYQTFIATPPTEGEVQDTQESKKPGLLTRLGSGFFWALLLFCLLVVYLLIIGGVYYTTLNPTPFWGSDRDGKINQLIQPGMRGQYAVEAYMILALGLVAVLSFITLNSVPSIKYTLFRMVVFCIAGPLFVASQAGLLWFFMKKYMQYLGGTQLHDIFVKLFFGNQAQHHGYGGYGGYE